MKMQSICPRLFDKKMIAERAAQGYRPVRRLVTSFVFASLIATSLVFCTGFVEQSVVFSIPAQSETAIDNKGIDYNSNKKRELASVIPFAACPIGKVHVKRASDFTASDYTYTGSHQFIDDGIVNNVKLWRVKFLTSGTFTPTKAITIDLFLVGGGAGGGGNGKAVGSGGGGGYTGTWSSIALNANQAYPVVIGAGGGQNGDGGSTSFNSTYSKAGGVKGTATAAYSYISIAGGNGGSGGGANGDGQSPSWTAGGNGGSDGANGVGHISAGGTGQNTTTREFGEAGATLYAAGGGGGAHSNSYAAGQGGDSTAGRGYGSPGGGPTAGVTNTGGGGGGGSDGTGYNGASGGSGICIIRNHR